MTDILNRLRDLAVQGANGVYDESSLGAMQDEADSLVAQLRQIQEGTSFNGRSIFGSSNATWSLAGANAATASLSALQGSNSAQGAGLQGIDTFSNTPDAKSSQGFIQQITRLSEEEAVEQGYTVIKTAQDLDNIRNNLSGKYILMNDIDLSTYSNWDPIGDDTAGFTGVLDGNGYTVSNLTCNIPDEHDAGLFGVTRDAEIRNVAMQINTQDFNSKSAAGALIARSFGTKISNCCVSGSISTDTTAQLGGLIGASDSTSIMYCYSTVNITNNDIGGKSAGLISVVTNSSITNSFSTGYIYSREYAGGIGALAQDNSIIENCYSTSKVEQKLAYGGAGAAGIITDLQDSTVLNCFATGDVSARGDYIGGLVGGNSGGVLKNSIWNTETTGQSTAVSINRGGTESNNNGLTTAEMQDPSNWTGWDTDIWDFSTYPPTFKMYSPIDAPSNPDDPNNPDKPAPLGSIRLQIGADSSENSAIFIDTSFSLDDFFVDFFSQDSCS